MQAMTEQQVRAVVRPGEFARVTYPGGVVHRRVDRITSEAVHFAGDGFLGEHLLLGDVRAVEPAESRKRQQ